MGSMANIPAIVVFLSSELEIAVVALLTKLTCDQSTQSVVYVQDLDFILERVRVQFISLTVQFNDSIKLLMLI